MRIHILPLTWPQLGKRYTSAEIWPLLAGADLAAAIAVLGGSDFLGYDWNHQELWLSSTTMHRLVATGQDHLFHNALGQAFVVTLDNERLYGGLIYNPGGAAALQFPVIHSLGDSGQVLRIRPALGAAWNPDRSHFPAEHAQIANPRLAAWLQTHGLLLTTPPAARPPEQGAL